MNAWMALPLAVRMLAVALLGAFVGVLVNRWAARLRLPWLSAAVARASQPEGSGRLVDWLPVAGWWFHRYPLVEVNPTGRRKHAPREKRRALRPLIVELSTAAGFAALYWWETARLGLVVPPLNLDAAAPFATAMQSVCAVHLVLVAFMLAATLIDLDEKIIPDAITVTGTIAALFLAALAPAASLPNVGWLANGRPVIEAMQLASPSDWPAALDGRPRAGSLALAMGCLGLACFALLPRNWRGRRGWRRALALCWARLRREALTRGVVIGYGLASVFVATAWYLGGPRWQSLLSALVGMVVTGGIVWLVRIIGAATLQREAMGFGDVTLMGMIGAFLGWQAGLMVFFVAPFFGLALGIVQAVAARDAEIPYGPYLCLGALAVIVRWPVLWEGTRDVFGVGWLLPAALVILFFLMALMLGAWGVIRRRWERE